MRHTRGKSGGASKMSPVPHTLGPDSTNNSARGTTALILAPERPARRSSKRDYRGLMGPEIRAAQQLSNKETHVLKYQP